MQKLLGSTFLYINRRYTTATKMIETIVEHYKSVFKLSDVKDAQILKVEENEGQDLPDVSLQVTWSSRNLSTMERSFTSCDYLVQGKKVTSFSPVVLSKDVGLKQHSISGKRVAHILSSEKDKEAQSVLITDGDGSVTTFNLKTADKHGKVYTDPEFSCLEWSPNEKKLLYVAEKKRPKPTSFLVPPKSDGEDTRGKEFEFVDEWGEQLEGKSQSVVCILDVESGEIVCHELPNELCPGQCVWAPNGDGLFGVAFVSKPYRLGLVYCPNRESKLFYMDLEGNYAEISQGYSNIRTPRVSPDGKNIAFLRTTVFGPHCKSSQLCLMSWPNKQEKIVIDVVPRTQTIKEGYSFKGLYGYNGLVRRCWLNDSKRIVFSTYKCDTVQSYVVNVDTNEITELPHLSSLSVLDVCNDWIATSFSFISQPHQIKLMRMPEDGQERSWKNNEVSVTPLRKVEGVPNFYHSHWSFVSDIPHPEPKYSDIPISCVYFGPPSLEKGMPKRPLIVWPHGGPHTVFANVYYSSATFFVKLGYSIVFPNYRGSLGYGEDGVNALPGHCGSLDVSDVYKATLSCLERFSDVLDPNQVFLFGGSHGGFLVTHLAAQHPEMYKAVSARNPVTDIASMNHVTDIPDWTFVESGYPFEYGKVATADILGDMFKKSPLSHVETLKAPTLLLLGKNDRRCPHSCGIFLHKMLLARGVETKMCIYDDCHPLGKVDVEFDALIQTALWFEKYKQ